MSSPVSISSAAQFTQLLSSTRVVVADFYADWCGPCKAIAPFYATLASKYSKPSAVVFTKINTDEQRSVTQTYNVSAMPTFIVFKSGREVSRIRGADPKALEAAVKGAVADVSSFEGSGRKLGDAVESAPKKTGLVEKGAGIGRPYVSNGRAVSSAPFTAKLSKFLDAAYAFIGLYLFSLFSFDPYSAAEASPFNQKNRSAGTRPGWLGYGGNAGIPSRPGASSSGTRKFGSLNDIRGGEAKGSS